MGGPPPGYSPHPAEHSPAPSYGGPPPAYSAQPPPLPHGWEQHHDPASGRPYFRNVATNETTWTPPSAPVHPAPAPGPAPGHPQPAPHGLPPGWEQSSDPATGRPYFFNHATGATSWTPP